MKTIKKLVAVVWPIIYIKLVELADKTETKFDDAAVEGINTAILEWLKDPSSDQLKLF